MLGTALTMGVCWTAAAAKGLFASAGEAAASTCAARGKMGELVCFVSAYSDDSLYASIMTLTSGRQGLWRPVSTMPMRHAARNISAPVTAAGPVWDADHAVWATMSVHRVGTSAQPGISMACIQAEGTSARM